MTQRGCGTSSALTSERPRAARRGGGEAAEGPGRGAEPRGWGRGLLDAVQWKVGLGRCGREGRGPGGAAVGGAREAISRGAAGGGAEAEAVQLRRPSAPVAGV